MTRFCPKCQIETERNADGRCKPCNNIRLKAWRAANQDRAKAYNAAWIAANPERYKARTVAWRKANLETRRVICQNYRARKRTNGGALSKDLAIKLLKLQKGKCPCCQQPLGIALGGSNTDENIQLLRNFCNKQKHAKHPIDFMQQKGFLL